MVKAKDWKRRVGYTAMIDVSAREQGRKTLAGEPADELVGQIF